MPAIRPLLIVGPGDHGTLVSSLRAQGFGPMLAPDGDQAVRLLRNFRVDAVVCVGLAAEEIRRLAGPAPIVVAGGTAAAAWACGAAGYVAAEAPPRTLAAVLQRVLRGERDVDVANARDGRDIA